MKDISLLQFGRDLQFKRLGVEELKQKGSFNLVDDNGQFVAMVVVPASAFKKQQITALAEAGNAALGR